MLRVDQACFRYLLCALAILVSACSENNNKDIEDYLSRLENVLEFKSKKIGSSAYPASHSFPRPREIQLIRHDEELTIREFLRLRECRLHSVLANKNSLLGKVAAPSQQLFVELAILDTGPECVSQLYAGQQNQIAAKLDNYLSEKHQTIMEYAWQAILGSNENQGFWASNTQPADYPKTLSREITQKIKPFFDLVNKINSNDFMLSSPEKTAIENALSELRYGDGGQLLLELRSLSNDLDRANQLISRALAKPLCLQGQATPQANYFKNVVTKFFIQKIQLRSIQLNQRYEQLMPNYLAMESKLLSAAPLAYQQWAATRQRDFVRYLAASKRHVEQVQSLFKQCGLQAGH